MSEKYKIKPVETAKAETEKSPFPKGYNLNNVTKSVETYIKGTYFPEEMTSGTGYKVDKSLQSQIAAASGQSNCQNMIPIAA